MIKRALALLTGVAVLLTSCPEFVVAAETMPVETQQEKELEEIEQYIDDIISGEVEVPVSTETESDIFAVEESVEAEESTQLIETEEEETETLTQEQPTETATVEETLETEVEENTVSEESVTEETTTEETTTEETETEATEETQVEETTLDDILVEESLIQETETEETLVEETLQEVMLLSSSSEPTDFDIYLADYWIEEQQFDFFLRADGSGPTGAGMPYRSTVDELSKDKQFRAQLATWETMMFVATEDGSDATLERSDMYQKVIYSIIKEYMSLIEATDKEESAEFTVNERLSTAIELAQMAQSAYDKTLDELFESIDFENMDDWTDEEYDYAIAVMDCMLDNFDARDMLKSAEVLLEAASLCEDAAEFIDKLSMVAILHSSTTELHSILMEMMEYTTDVEMDYALLKMASYCNVELSEPEIYALFAGEMALQNLAALGINAAREALEKNLYVSGFTNTVKWTNEAFDIVFSHDALIESFYCMKVTREFEKALTKVSDNYRNSLTKATTIDSQRTYARDYNIAINLHLGTMLVGLNYAQNHQEELATGGIYNMFANKKKVDAYKEYVKNTALVCDTLKSLTVKAKEQGNHKYNTNNLAYLTYYGVIPKTRSTSSFDINDYIVEDPQYDEEEMASMYKQVVDYMEKYMSLTISSNYTLTKDMAIEGDVTINGGTLDLNGYTLTTEGRVDINAGTLEFNGGTLNVSGDFNIGTKEEADTAPSSGIIKMENAEDELNVEGDFVVANDNASTLTAGTINLKGDFAQYGTDRNRGYSAYRANFSAAGSHKVVFCGEEPQSIYFEAYADSGFAKVYFENQDIEFKSGIRGITLQEDTILNLTIPESGLYVSGTLDLSGQTVNVDEFNLRAGTIYFNGGTMNVSGDFSIGTKDLADTNPSSGKLIMEDAEAELNIEGNLVIASNSSSTLTAGTIKLKGDISQYGTYQYAGYANAYKTNFSAGGSHKVVFCGEEPQSIYFDSYEYSGFAKVYFENQDIEFKSGIRGITLQEDTVLNLTIPESGLYVSGTLDLNGQTVNVDEFNLREGTIDFNGGTMNVSGDFRIGTKELADTNPSSGILKMENAEDELNVEGDFVVANDNASALTAGTINLKGDFAQYGIYKYRGYDNAYYMNFTPSGTHKVILSGDEPQTVYFESTYSYFNILELQQKLEKYDFTPDECWKTLIMNVKTAEIRISEIADYVYTGEEIVPVVEVYGDDKLLTEGVDYTVTVTNNIAAADKASENAPTVMVQCMGDYEGTYTVTFSILPITIAGLESLEVTLEKATYMYTGEAITPEVEVLNGAKKLEQDVDYTVAYEANIQPGIATVTITGMGNYAGEVVKSFRIISKMISDVVVKGADGENLADQPYTGGQIQPEIVVYDEEKLLTEGVDYQITYGENVALGEGTLTLEGIGVYDGSREICFDIVRADIASDAITVDAIADCRYTTANQEPEVTVRHGELVLVEGEDYELSYANNKLVAAADAKKAPTVTITGIGNYEGKRKVTFAIIPETLDVNENTDLVMTVKDATYNAGKACKPSVTIMDGKYKLMVNKDYTLVYANNKEATARDGENPATVTIIGKGNYAGSEVTLTFGIYAKISGVSVKGSNGKTLASQIYTGEQITPDILVYNGKTLLEEGVDYTLSYGENIEVGKGQIILEGIGVFSGTKTVTFSITAYDMKGANITVDAIDDCIYDGTSLKPAVTVWFGDTALVENVDYKLSYANNKNVALSDAKKAPTVTITGKGNFKGTMKTTFTILPASLETEVNEDMVVTVTDSIYNKGKACKPSVTLKDGKYKLVNKKDYTLSYANNFEIAEKSDNPAPTVIITGKGNYAGSQIEVPFRIYEAAISKSKIASIAAMTYTGEELTPDVVVTMKQGKTTITLEEGVDYYLTYSNNVNAGTGKVVVNGMGLYGGTKTASFKINKRSLKAEDIVFMPIDDLTYAGSALKPAVEIYDGDVQLVLNKDYTLKYSNNTKVASADAKKAPTVTITGKGNYSGTQKLTFNIEKASLQEELNTDLVISVADIAYSKGAARKPAVKITDGKYTLKVNKDYTLVYGNNRNIAEKDSEDAPYVQITGKGNYESETVTVYFRIYEKNISTAKVASIAKQKYTGEQIMPDITVTYGSGKSKITLEEGTDYILRYGENVKSGTGYVYIDGIGTYGGTKKISFKIVK